MEDQIELSGLGKRAYFEFSDAADYVWKCPEFINDQTKLELEKLDSYFPMTGDAEEDAERQELRKLRWRHEKGKLEQTFPYLMASGNLFTAISLFETYCLMLCKQLEPVTGVAMKCVKGKGLVRVNNYLSEVGVAPDRAPFRSEVAAAFRIRNCMFHASGILSWSHDETELRRIVSSASFLSLEHRSSKQSLGKRADEVAIISGPLGDRLQINNMYPFVLLSYLRDNFVGLYRQSPLNRSPA